MAHTVWSKLMRGIVFRLTDIQLLAFPSQKDSGIVRSLESEHGGTPAPDFHEFPFFLTC